MMNDARRMKKLKPPKKLCTWQVKLIAEGPQLNVAEWRHSLTKIWLKIGSGYGLLLGNTNSMHNPVLIYHQRFSVAFAREQYHKMLS